MNQSYAEAGVKRKTTIAFMALRVLMILGIILGAFLMLYGKVTGIIGAVIVIAMIYLLPKLNIEYEYVFVDGQLDFDRITGKSKRKTMLRIDLEQVEIIAPEGSHALDGYTYVQFEKKDFSSGKANTKPYIIIVNSEKKRYRIAFEPSEKMLLMIKQKNPRKLAPY